MSKKEWLAAVDLGTNKVCTILACGEANGEDDDLQVMGVGMAPSRGVVKGIVVNIDDAAHAIRESVKKAELQSGHGAPPAFVSVSGSHIASVNSRSVVAIGNGGGRGVRGSDVRRALSSARSLDLPAGRRLMQVIPKEYVLDTSASVKDPKGMRGYRLDLDAHLITGAETCLTNLRECIHRAGVNAKGFVPAALAAAQGVLNQAEIEEGVLLLDIGGSTVDVAVFQGGSVEHISVLPVGGNNITKDLSIILGLPYEVAERVKEAYGDLLYQHAAPVYKKDGEAEEKDEDTVKLSNGLEISRHQVNDIIRSRLVEIIRLALVQTGGTEQDKPYTSFVLVGGTSNVPGMEWLAEAVTRLPARVAMPTGIYGLCEPIQNPAYACSVGLLRWGLHYPGNVAGNGSAIRDVMSTVKHVALRSPVTLHR